MTDEESDSVGDGHDDGGGKTSLIFFNCFDSFFAFLYFPIFGRSCQICTNARLNCTEDYEENQVRAGVYFLPDVDVY